LKHVAKWSIAAVMVVCCSLLGPAVLGGSTTYVTTHGISMQPEFQTGDLAVFRAAGHYGVGDIAAYHSDLLKTVVMHRIVAVEGRHVTFKGDNNSWLDPEHPRQEELVGKLAVRIPQGGIWLERLTSATGLGLIAFVMVAGSGGAVQTRRRRKRRNMSCHSPTLRGLSMSALAAGPPWLRTAAAGTASVGVLGLALAALAWTGPVMTAVSSEASARGSMTFSYTTSVPRTVAYDGVTVTSPDPVFRKLANTVDVHYAYDGSPGSVAVVAEISTASGWHSTVQLAKPKTFTTDRTHGTVRLNLKALEVRAQAAGALTGIPVSGVTVAVIPRVDTAAGARFAPSLSLSLSPLQLTLPGGTPALVVKDSAAVKQSGTAARTIGVLGGHITVATARILSTILLLGGLLGAAVLLPTARRFTPTSEAEGICRRYAALLVPVRPMAVPSGRPVVDVDDFATLARLAERYGLLVMHWRRSGVETFVVQDEGTTYRYRTNAGEASDPVTVVVSGEGSP
jgi:signal peptidase I